MAKNSIIRHTVTREFGSGGLHDTSSGASHGASSQDTRRYVRVDIVRSSGVSVRETNRRLHGSDRNHSQPDTSSKTTDK